MIKRAPASVNWCFDFGTPRFTKANSPSFESLVETADAAPRGGAVRAQVRRVRVAIVEFELCVRVGVKNVLVGFGPLQQRRAGRVS